MEEEKINNAKKWLSEPFKPEHNPYGVIDESSFAVMFPTYREKYLSSIWPALKNRLQQLGIESFLDVLEGTMTVSTTKKMFDPYMIIKARDVIRLLSRSVSIEQAIRVLEDDVTCEIIKIRHLVPNLARFIKRRNRLLGPNGSTLKAIELLTECYILVHGNTVAVIGSYQGIERAKKIITDTMKNVHPIYNIKTLMIQRELAKNETLKNEDWSRFLPKFKKANKEQMKKKLKKNKPQNSFNDKKVVEKIRKKKKPYDPFPPAQPLSKIDKQLETGEYFMKPVERKMIKHNQTIKNQEQVSLLRKQQKEKLLYSEPLEKSWPLDISTQSNNFDNNLSENVENLKKKIQSKSTKMIKFNK